MQPPPRALPADAGFWTGVWGAFTVNSARSFDAGATWVQPTVVYAPDTGSDAGSPQVSICSATHKIVVIYMTNEPLVKQSFASAGGAWPDGARIEVRSTVFNWTNSSAPLDWAQAPRGNIPLATPSGYWPAMFLDAVSSGSSGGANPSMRASYQGSDGSAWATDGTLCLS